MASLVDDSDVQCYGGAAGTYKSDTALAEACAEKDKPWAKGVTAYIFRRSYPELEELMDRSQELYSNMGGVFHEGKKQWRLPGGLKVRFRYAERDKDVFRQQGKQMTKLLVDESTHYEEKHIRYLISRNRANVGRWPDIKVCTRLYTNPGNVGHKFHRHVFMKNVCPHCEPEKSVVPGKKYFDATWLDGRPLELSTCFIPAKMTDDQRSLLGPDYVKKLRMQSAATAEALLNGCWAAFEGLYFDCFNRSKVVKRQLVGEQPWWPHWAGGDYGFSISIAAAYLMCRRPPYVEEFSDGTKRHWPKGRVYFLDEWPPNQNEDHVRVQAPDFTRALARRWLGDPTDANVDLDRVRRIMAWYLSPDAFNRSGIQGFDNIHTRSDQMNKAFAEYARFGDHSWMPANNDRPGSATYLYTGLYTGEIVVCDTCHNLIDALETRIHDEDKPDDVLKVHGDPLDDYYDAARYASYSHTFSAKKPKEERVQEAMQGKDPLNAFLTRVKIEAEIEREDEPVIVSGTAARRGLTGRVGSMKKPGFGRGWRRR